LVFHPCSNGFAPALRPVWQEAFRVLRPGGVLLSGFTNPVRFIFDEKRAEQGELFVRHAIPYADHISLTNEECQWFIDNDEPLMFGHTLEDQIGGQLDAGFKLTGLYEDHDTDHPLMKFLPTYIATRAEKPLE